MEREITVRHVFEGFVEGGIRNPECGIRNHFKCNLLEHILQFYTFFVSRSSIRITIIISPLTLQDIAQNVSETLADEGIKEPLSNLAFCCYSNVSSAVI